MVITHLKLKNFGSYEELEFNFDKQGLALIHGETGSGKSTLLDAVAWGLFAITSKNGSVDEVRSWTAPTLPTQVTLHLETILGPITVVRTRGSQKENDLYWCEEAQAVEQRGKDLKDTQKRLNERLGITPELFLAGSYFCEFSPSATFFTDNNKVRRELFENITDLGFPVLLMEKVANERKKTDLSLRQNVAHHSTLLGQLRSSRLHLVDSQHRSEQFEQTKADSLGALHSQAKDWDQRKEKELQTLIENSCQFADTANEALISLYSRLVSQKQALEEHTNQFCNECGSPDKSYQYLVKVLEITEYEIDMQMRKVNPYTDRIQQLENSQNPFTKEIERKKREIDPFLAQKHTLTHDIRELENDERLADLYSIALENRLTGLEQLKTLSSNLRGKLLLKAIADVEQETNRLIGKYFDAEFVVHFSVQDSGDLDVSITKNGYSCVYKQLSKGQRQILKLSFAIAIIKAAQNAAGINFNLLMFDEPTDGCDTSLKIKAFSIFEELSLSYDSILVIEHSNEVKEMFDKKYKVTMNADISRLDEQP